MGTPAAASAVGAWRPTPALNASGAGPQFATMTPWVLTRPGQFRLPPPLDLSSSDYLADYNEVRTMGIFDGSGRTSDQSELALFWAGNTPLYWNRIASQIAAARSLSLSQNAHLFALMNVAMADAAILLGQQISLRILASDHGHPRSGKPESRSCLGSLA